MSEKPETSAAPQAPADVPTLRLDRRWAEGAILVLVLLAGIWFWTSAQLIQTRSGDAVGARSFPTALAILLIGITGLALIRAIRLPAGTQLTVRRPVALLTAMAMLLAFPWVVEVLGYYVIIVPWVLGFGWAARVRAPGLAAITLGTVLFVAFFIFQMVLGTPLP